MWSRNRDDDIKRPERNRVRVVGRSQQERSLQRPRSALSGVSYQTPEVAFHSYRAQTVTVTFPGPVCRSITEHCHQSNTHGREVAGLLIGTANERGGWNVIVTDILPFPDWDSSGSHVTVTSEVWAYIDREFEDRFRNVGKDRLGWYHTHPTQGVYLFSQQDRDFHSVFTREFQFALVVDPRRMQGGIYSWAVPDRSRISDVPVLFQLGQSANLPDPPQPEPQAAPKRPGGQREIRIEAPPRPGEFQGDSDASAAKLVAGIAGIGLLGAVMFLFMEPGA